MNNWELERDNNRFLLQRFNPIHWAYDSIDISKNTYNELNSLEKMFPTAFACECKCIWESYEAEKVIEKENDIMESNDMSSVYYSIDGTNFEDEDGKFWLERHDADVINRMQIQWDDFDLLQTVGCGTKNGQAVACRLWNIYMTNAKEKVCDDNESDEKPKNDFLSTFESLYLDGRIRNMTLDYTDKGFDIHLNINKLGQPRPLYSQSSNAYWSSCSNTAQPTTINNIYNDAVDAVEKYGKENKTDEED